MEDKVILSINAGSSSVKISVYVVGGGGAGAGEERGPPRQVAEAQLSGLTAPPARLRYTRRGQTVVDGTAEAAGVRTHDDAFGRLLATLVEDAGLPELARPGDVAVACHRVVHGGDYAAPRAVTPATYHQLEALADLAPLHNARALGLVRACAAALPGARNVACFDSQFHAAMPAHVYTYPVDPAVARKNRLRKYGFHGLSYQFITAAVARFLAKDPRDLNLIALHLGSGASACAIKHGRSYDNSMGLTPLAGLPGATRSGSVDPSLVFHYASDVGKLSPASTEALHISRAEEILNQESGWRALTGTADFGAIAASAAPADRLAFDLFADRVCGYVGAYYVALGGAVDALVFAGGIGERCARLRRAVTRQAACLGFALDDARNDQDDDAAPAPAPAPGDHARAVRDIGRAGARHRTLVCYTDEQFEMARGCAADPDLWK